MMMDAGWALAVFRFSMTVFFVIVPQSCLHVCMSPLTWGGEMTHGSSSDTDDSGETACDGEEDTTEIKRCLDVNQS